MSAALKRQQTLRRGRPTHEVDDRPWMTAYAFLAWATIGRSGEIQCQLGTAWWVVAGSSCCQLAAHQRHPPMARGCVSGKIRRLGVNAIKKVPGPVPSEKTPQVANPRTVAGQQALRSQWRGLCGPCPPKANSTTHGASASVPVRCHWPGPVTCRRRADSKWSGHWSSANTPVA